MERATALRTLRKLLGDKLGYRVDITAPDAATRVKAREEAKVLSAQYKAAEEARTLRLAAILAADPEYQRLKAKVLHLRDAKDKAWAITRHFKFMVGVSGEVFFTVKAEGDSWEDVIAQLKNGKARP